MRHTNEDDNIRHMALDLEVGDRSGHLVCPFCSGGQSKETSFTILRIGEGLIYRCYRLKCGARGFISSLATSLPKEKPSEKKKVKPFWRETRELGSIEMDFFYDKFGLLSEEMEHWRYCDSLGRVVMPIHSHTGYEIGHVARYYPELENENTFPSPKTIAYFEDQDRFPRVHFSGELSDKIVVLEDIVSATKVGRYVPACALLGTNMTEEMATHLANLGVKEVKIFLDPDAMQKAVKMRDSLALMFRQVEVILEDEDPKDLEADYLEERLTND